MATIFHCFAGYKLFFMRMWEVFRPKTYRFQRKIFGIMNINFHIRKFLNLSIHMSVTMVIFLYISKEHLLRSQNNCCRHHLIIVSTIFLQGKEACGSIALTCFWKPSRSTMWNDSRSTQHISELSTNLVVFESNLLISTVINLFKFT